MKPRNMSRNQAITWVWYAWHEYGLLTLDEARDYIGWIATERDHLRGMAHAILTAHMFPNKFTAFAAVQKLKGDF